MRTAVGSNSEITQAGVLRLASRLRKSETPTDEDHVAQKHASNLMITMSTLARNLENVQKSGWRFASKDLVRAKLEEFLTLCQ